MTERDDMPELPEMSYLGDDASWGYDAQDMRDYARQYAAQEVAFCMENMGQQMNAEVAKEREECALLIEAETQAPYKSRPSRDTCLRNELAGWIRARSQEKA